MDNSDTRKLILNQQLSQNKLKAEAEEKEKLKKAKEQIDKSILKVHTEVKTRIKTKNLFEPTEVSKCVTRATFFLTDKEEYHALANSDGTSLPPFHRQFLSNLQTESEEILNEMVKAICFVPRGTEDRYIEWLKEQRNKRFPENGNWASERGLQVGSFGTDTIARIRDGFMSMVVKPALNKTFATATASTVVDDVTTLMVNDTTKAITTEAALKSSKIVTGGYCLYKIGYNVYRVVKHGRSWKFAVKNVLDDTGSVAVANIVGAKVLVGLSASLGAIPALLLGIGLGILVSWIVSPGINWMSRKLFNVSEDEYLDKAYRHFSVAQGTDIKEIFKKYRLMSRDNHEDMVRGRPQNEIDEHKRIFHKTQYAMAMISAAIEKNEEDYQLARYNFEKADREEYGGDFIDDSWINFKKWCKRKWNGYEREEQDLRVLEITSGQLPYDFFLEEDDLKKLEKERLKKSDVGMIKNMNSQTNTDEGNVSSVNTESSVEEMERLLGE